MRMLLYSGKDSRSSRSSSEMYELAAAPVVRCGRSSLAVATISVEDGLLATELGAEGQGDRESALGQSGNAQLA